MGAFLGHRDLFPDAPSTQPRATHPESGVLKTAGRTERAYDEEPLPIDPNGVPVLLVPVEKVRACIEDARARWVAPFIDGVSPLQRVLADCGLAESDALTAFELLMDEGLIALL
jgi:hypothetical protein